MRLVLALLALLLSISPASAEEPTAATEQAEAPKTKRFSWFVLPTPSFDTDDGLGIGIRGEIQKLSAAHDPYQVSVMVHAYLSLRGYHHHRFYVDLPGLGRNHRTRVRIRLAYRQWLNDGYWGMGDGTAREREYVGSFERDDPRRKRYRYWLMQPYGFVGVRHELGDSPFSLFGSLTVQWTRVTTYAGSVLEEQQPYGMDGGVSTMVTAGVALDTRAPEAAPDRGVVVELSGRFAPDFPGSAGAFGGPFASFRGSIGFGGCDRPWPPYVMKAAERRRTRREAKGKPFRMPADPFPGCRVVLAGRLMAEWLVGDVPFYEMARWGSLVPILGFGGSETLRGAPFGRWRAPGRAVGNVELRIDVVRHRLFGDPLRWQLVPFVDVGAVWGAGAAATARAPEVPLHPSVGAGIHLVWAQSFAARVDVAVGPDPIREPDGSITQAPNLGFYLMFDQMY